MWWRRSWFSLKGKAGIPAQTKGRAATPIALRVPPVGSLQQRVTGSRAESSRSFGVRAADLVAAVPVWRPLLRNGSAVLAGSAQILEFEQHGKGPLQLAVQVDLVARQTFQAIRIKRLA